MGEAPGTRSRRTHAIRTAIVVGALLLVAWFASPIKISVWAINYDYQNHGSGSDGNADSALLGAINEIVQFVSDETWPPLYELAAAELQASVTARKFVENWQRVFRSVYGIEEIEVLEIVVTRMEEEHLVGSTYVYPWVPSQVLPPHLTLSSPISGRIAFVLCRSLTDNGTMVTWVSVVLKLEEAGWKLVQLFLSPAEIAGHDGKWFWNKSQDFKLNGQYRNAFFYSQFALSLLAPSPAISSAELRDFQDELIDPDPLSLPLIGQRPPEQWTIDDELTVTVDYIAPVASGEIFWLEIRFKTSIPDVQSEAAIAERKRFHQYVLETFPEYQDGFAGIYVGSVNKDGAGFREAFPFDEANPQQTPRWDN